MFHELFRKEHGKRVLSVFLTLAMLVSMLPTFSLSLAAASSADRVADPSTANNYTSMLGTEADGNRYSGRVWSDKSVFTDASVSLDGHTVTNNGDFMVVYSALGSSTSVTTSTTSAANLDVVFVLDNSTSMGTDNRLVRVVNASNDLLAGLVGPDNRIAVVTFNAAAKTVVPLSTYSDLTLSAPQGSTVHHGWSGPSGGLVEAHSNGRKIGDNGGYQYGTFTQAGIDMGMKILEENAQPGRVPVLIVLADGMANIAVGKDWQNVSMNNDQKPSSDGDMSAGVTLSTLLNASYMKSAVENAYGRSMEVYGITVEVAQDEQADAFSVMDPANYFKSNSTSAVGRTAYGWYQSWVNVNNPNTVIERTDALNWEFEQVTPNNAYGVTKQQVMDNIAYVDKHYTANNTDELDFAFEQILTTIKTPAFYPTIDTIVQGDSTLEVPLTYVDFIGEYMQVDAINKVLLFDKEYNVAAGNATVHDPVATPDGKVSQTTVTPYTVGVGEAAITHPTLGTIFNISDVVRMELTSVTTGVINGSTYVPQTVPEQTLRVFIESEALPVIVDSVTVDVDENGDETVKFTESTGVTPIRVFYTVSMADQVMKNGDIDLSKVDKAYIANNIVNGKVQFYANRYGEMNEAQGGVVTKGDAHVSFTPSAENRYYYHQNSYAVFTKATDAQGNPLVFDNQEFGILHDEGYKYEYLSAADLFQWDGNNLVAADNALKDTDEVYTYVEYYHETNTGADTGELVHLLAYANWGELKNSLTPVLLNGQKDPVSNQALFDYVDPDKKAMTSEQLRQYIEDNYDSSFDLSNIRARLAVGSLRQYRLHHMTENKAENKTGTATVAYAPTYNTDTAHVGAIAVWLGNNGVLSATVPLGITISKTVTGGAVGENFTFTVTSSDTAETGDRDAVRVLADGTAREERVTFAAGVAKVVMQDGEMLYISDLDGNNQYTVTEEVSDKYNLSTINGQEATSITLTPEAAGNAKAAFVNVPKVFGNLTINKVVEHPFGAGYAVPSDDFIIETTLTDAKGAPVANKTFTATHSGNGALATVTTDAQGKFLAYLSNNEQLTIYGLEEGTVANGRELYYDGSSYYAYGDAADKWYPGFSAPTYWDSDQTANDDQVVVVGGQTVTAGVVNHYAPAPASTHLSVHGEKHIAGLADWEFTFHLQKWNGSRWTTVATSTVTDANPTYSLTKLQTFDAVGTYSYQVVEVNDGKPGITYDPTQHTFTVTVTDTDMDGHLEIASVVSDHTGVAFEQKGNRYVKVGVDFTNQYQSGKATAVLNIQKELTNSTGSPLVNLEGYSFELYEKKADGTRGNLVAKSDGHTDAVGEAQIIWEISDVGEYAYWLVEVDSGIPGMNYAADIPVTVKVTDNGDGTKSATVTVDAAYLDADGDEIVMKNIYAPTDATWTPAVKKVLTGRNMAAGEFAFTLSLDTTLTPSALVASADIEKTSATNAAANNGVAADVDFGTVTFSKVGTYYFTVAETPKNGNGLTSDSTVFYVRVDVTDGNGTLVATPTVYNVVGTTMTFENTYAVDPVTYSVAARKELIGRDLKAGEFTFAMTDGTHTWYASNEADGSIRFPAIRYTEAGTYTYTLTELSGHVPGVTAYDTNRYTVTVTVTDNGLGQLEASGTDRTASVTFGNTYEAIGSIILSGRKYVTGNVPLDNNKFTFDLYASDPNGTKGTFLKQATLTDGAFTFAVKYTLADVGIHYYLVEETGGGTYEIDGNNEYGLHYDSRQYLVAVEVADNGDGTLATTATKTRLDTGAAYENLVFVNQYEDILLKEVYGSADPEINIDGTSVSVGDTLDYTVTYYNGNTAQADVTITDTVPAGTTYVAGSADNNGLYENGELTWNLTVPAGERVTVHFQVTVDDPGEDIKNTAVAVSGGNTHTSNEVVNYTYEKTVDKDKAIPGETLTYEGVYKNNTNEAVSVTFTDKLDTDLVYDENSALGALYDAAGQPVAGSEVIGVYAGGVLTWTFTNVQPGETAKVFFTGKVAADAAVDAVVDNTIAIQENTLLVKTNTVITDVQVPGFTINKTQAVNGGTATADKLTAKVGDTVTYTITVENTGETELTHLVITDAVPAGMTVKAIANDGVAVADVITWTISSLPVGESVTVSFTAEVPYVAQVTTFKNVAAAKSDTTPEPKESNEVELDVVPPVLNVEISKTQAVNDGAATADKLTAKAGDTVTYAITVKNTGEWELTDLVVKDTVPAGLVLGTVNNAGVNTDGEITWTIASLPVGESATVSFTATVPAVTEDTAYKNVAVVVFDKDYDDIPEEIPSNEVEINVEKPEPEPDPDPKPEPEPEPDPEPKPEPQPEPKPELKLDVTKTQALNGGKVQDDLLYVQVGDIITYYITVKNVGDAAIDGISLIDALPKGLVPDVDTISHGGTYVNGEILWNITHLEVGESVTVSFDAPVPDVEKGTSFANIAIAVFDEGSEGAPEQEMSSTKVVFQVEAPDTDSPQTSDNSQLALWFAMLFVSVGGMVTTLFRKKKA